MEEVFNSKQKTYTKEKPMDVYINPTGNFFERLRACWVLFRHPDDFINGIIVAYRHAVIARAEAAFLAASNSSPEAAPGEQLELSLEAVGMRAASEAENG